MHRQAVVEDLGVHLSRPTRLGLKMLAPKIVGRRLTSTWHHSAITDAVIERRLERSARTSKCDVVVQIQDLAAFTKPYIIVQDLSYDLLLEEMDRSRSNTVPHFRTLDRELIMRRRDRQRRIYEQAAGVVAMSDWLRDSLVTTTGLSPDQVHRVYPGATAAQEGVGLGSLPGQRNPRLGRTRNRLLFIGRDFETKGGDQVVAAFRILRATHDPKLELTIAGPGSWPLPGDIPDGIRFLGRISLREAWRLFGSHDLFVMPSRFEGFGIVFVEALSAGMPCIGRWACAMPEMISPGGNGALVSTDEPEELSRAILDVLSDDRIYERAWADRGEVRDRFTWNRAATSVLDIAYRSL